MPRGCAVAELAASLAHEIKNPLASIRSAVEQLASGRIPDADRAVLERLVLAESDRLSRLLSAFIEFSWVTLRQREVVDLVGVTEEAISLVRQHPDAAEGARIEFSRPGEALTVEGERTCSPRHLNLILNAVQHAGPQGGYAFRSASPPMTCRPSSRGPPGYGWS